jgi:hypothetical protein
MLHRRGLAHDVTVLHPELLQLIRLLLRFLQRLARRDVNPEAPGFFGFALDEFLAQPQLLQRLSRASQGIA